MAAWMDAAEAEIDVMSYLKPKPAPLSLPVRE
jgi:hypothetical protein